LNILAAFRGRFIVICWELVFFFFFGDGWVELELEIGREKWKILDFSTNFEKLLR
jgi:hypothetical protein